MLTAGVSVAAAYSERKSPASILLLLLLLLPLPLPLLPLLLVVVVVVEGLGKGVWASPAAAANLCGPVASPRHRRRTVCRREGDGKEEELRELPWKGVWHLQEAGPTTREGIGCHAGATRS